MTYALPLLFGLGAGLLLVALAWSTSEPLVVGFAGFVLGVPIGVAIARSSYRPSRAPR